MWIGTNDGLNRYDGYNILEFRSQPDNIHAGKEKGYNTSLVHGSVTYIAEHSADRLWICTEQGVSILNLKNYFFEPFPYLDRVRVSFVMTDHLGYTWFCSNTGLYRYTSKDSTIINYRNNPSDDNSLSFDQVTSCFEDQELNLWVHTFGGMNLYNREKDNFSRFFTDYYPGSEAGKQVQKIVRDKNGNLWLAFLDRGVGLMRYNAPKVEYKGIYHNPVSSIGVDKFNNLWIGNSLGNGITILDLDSFHNDGNIIFKNFRNEYDDPLGLTDNTIYAMFEDRDGGFWIGTYAGGINYHSPLMKSFNTEKRLPGNPNTLNNNVVNCFAEDGKYLWVGTEEGLSRIDRKTGVVKNFLQRNNDPGSLLANGIICMLIDSRRNFWVGTWAGGLNLYNPVNETFKKYLKNPGKEGSISGNDIFVLLEDSRGILWVGTNDGGLNSYDYKTDKFTHYTPQPDNPNSLYHIAVNDICEISTGELLISMYHAMDIFDITNKTFSHYVHDPQDTNTISSGNIMDIFEDSRENIWVATTTGLNLFNRSGKKFIRYNLKYLLADNSTMAINEDDKGNLWISTNNGLSKLNGGVFYPDNAIVQNYSVVDGLQGNEFIRRSTFKNKDGILFFGGSKGFNWFHPDSIKNNPIPPVVALTGFSLIHTSDGREVEPELSNNINSVNVLHLTHKQNDFVIYYSALNYLNSSKNQYEYILEGYDKDWHHAGNKHEATFTNINHGNYVFKVRGSNNDGVWSNEAKELKIIIHPPWWDTLFMRIVWIILAINLVLFFHQFRLISVKRQKQVLEVKVKERTSELVGLNTLLLEKQEEISLQNEELSNHRNNLEKIVEERTLVMKKALQRAEEADKLKSAFLANMSHEIRTPMNAIMGFASLLKSESVSEDERKEFIQIIMNNCEMLMVLINDILEISLIEANQIKLTFQPFDVTKILEELESYFQLYNEKGLSISFRNKNSGESIVLNNDAVRFRQVFVNLLNNAYKYTEKGTIEYGYMHENENLVFLVSDSGIGIAESEYQNIFNYFHKIDKGENHLYRGAGIGLSICNKLVDLMGGKIWLESKVGEGTTFYFTFSDYKVDMKPVSEEQNPGTREEEINYYSLEGKTIIVAEDENTNYILMEKMLMKTKAAIKWAKNGKEAVDFASDPDIAGNCIVLMDIKMPVLNGLKASEQIKKINSTIPVIAVTAFAQDENKEEIMKYPFDDYIPKPFDSKMLFAAIYKYLK